MGKWFGSRQKIIQNRQSVFFTQDYILIMNIVCTLYTQFSLRTARCSFVINDFTITTKSRQQCRERDQECIIIVSPIYITISLWFETSALQKYKYDKHTYPLRFVTSWIWQTVSFPVYFQRRFRQGPHQNLEKNSNCQVLAINA